jgi:hypothetical protein
MEIDKFTELDLDRLDRLLKLSIQSGYAPFLGLQKSLFPPETRTAINDMLRACNSPLNTYLSFLSRWPAVFLAYLTIYVAEGFGEHGTFEVYPFVVRALADGGLTLSQKDRLWRAYRRHSISLGLSVSPRLSGANFMVEEYLRQAGVPLKYVPELAVKMKHYANAVGLPDEDDPSAIRLWQQGLCERLTTPFPRTVRKAVEADDTGYYVGQFIKLLDKPLPDSGTGDFESIMSRAIHEGPVPRPKICGIGIPQVAWRDQRLGVELPSGESNSWKITVSSAFVEFRGMLEKRFVPFDQVLPADVQIDHGEGRVSRKFSLWEDGRNNRLLIFSNEGTLVCGSRLGAENPVTLEPGNYQLISRFVPEGMEESIEEVHSDPALYVFPICLQPSQHLIITRGPASVTIVADSKPLILWEGESVKDVRGNELFCSSGTYLKVIIPSELMLGGEAKYLVRLNPGCLGQSVEIPVESAVEGHLDIDIAAVAKQWTPGVTRLLAEIQRRDLQRAYVRSAIYLWNGLERIENRTAFFCSVLPSNLNLDESDNLLISAETSHLTFRNDNNRFFRMVFNMHDNKQVTFTSAVPGIFMQIEDYADSHVTERPLKKGSTLSVAWNSRSVLEIFSTTNGTLRIGSFEKSVDFSRCGCKRLPLSGLVEYLGPMADALQFVDEGTGFTEDLLHLVAPHEVLTFSLNWENELNIYQILFTLAHEVSDVSVAASDILSGRTETLLLKCNSGSDKSDSFMNGWLTSEHNIETELYEHHLKIAAERWPDGAWIFDIDVNINGRWGGLSNARGDVYKAGFIIADGTATDQTLCLQGIKTEGSEEIIAMLRRVQGHLSVCYSQESWDELAWLDELWHILMSEAKVRDELVGDLIELSDLEAPDNVPLSWIPMRSIAARNPGLFGKPVKVYRGLRGQRSLFLRTLHAMSLLEVGVLPLIIEGYFHQILAIGFKNVLQMQTGAQPKGFHLQQYKAALQGHDLTERLRLLEQESWEPAIGDFLGAVHYLFVLKKLEKRYENSLAGNEYRRGKALFLCRNIHNVSLSGCPEHLSTATHIGYLFDESELIYSATQQMVLEISRFLSLLAKACRWEARHEGTLQKFTVCMREQLGNQDKLSDVLSYMLYVGKELFVFYLLLWEIAFNSDCGDESR